MSRLASRGVMGRLSTLLLSTSISFLLFTSYVNAISPAPHFGVANGAYQIKDDVAAPHQAPLRSSRSQAEFENPSLHKVHILGTDDRQPEEHFGNPENLKAQKILGLQEIQKSISAVVPIECFYDENGKSYHDLFNGTLVCDRRTVVVNAHSLVNALCNDERHDFFCRIPETNGYSIVEFAKPSERQMKSTSVCDAIEDSDDIALLKTLKPLQRKPIKVGAIKDFSALKGRSFVEVSANVGLNFYNRETEKTFMVGIFDKLTGRNLGTSDVDSQGGSSGAADLISQDGELVLVGIRKGGFGRRDSKGVLIDGLRYSWGNYGTSLVFNDETLPFLKKNIEHADKCVREIRPANEVSN